MAMHNDYTPESLAALLRYAINSNDVKTLQSLKDQGVDLKTVRIDGLPLFRYAEQNRKYPAARKLIDLGVPHLWDKADARLILQHSNAFIIYCCQAIPLKPVTSCDIALNLIAVNNLRSFRILYEQDVFINLTEENKQDIIRLAETAGMKPLVSLIMDNAPEHHQLRMTHIMNEAIERRNLNDVITAHQNGGYPHIDSNKFMISSPFIKAAKYGHLEIFTYLMKYQNNVAVDNEGAYLKSACNGHYDILEILCKTRTPSEKIAVEILESMMHNRQVEAIGLAKLSGIFNSISISAQINLQSQANTLGIGQKIQDLFREVNIYRAQHLNQMLNRPSKYQKPAPPLKRRK